ncbi:MAG: hypothetical protein ABL921_24555 [Pirellula sp.]
MDKRTDTAFRFSLLSLLVVTSYVAGTLALVSYTNNTAFGIHLSLGLVGWIMWRYAHGHLGGLIPTLLGGDLLLSTSINWVFAGSEDFLGLRAILSVFASLLVFSGLGVFAWIGAKKLSYWRNQVGIAALVFCTLVAWWVAIPSLGNATVARRQALDIAANKMATAKAIWMVEDAIRRTGKTPDSDSLAAILHEPLPSVRWDFVSGRIHFQKTSETTFQLTYIDPSMCFMGDIVVYDSATPKRGWYRIRF